MKNLASFCFLGVFIFLTACQPATKKEKKEPNTYAKFVVQYRQNDRLFIAEASYAIGDSLANAQAAEMSSVNFQGSPMDLNNSARKSLFYKTERQSNFQNLLKFKTTAPSGKKMTTDFQFEAIESFLVKDQISKEKGLTIVWKGLPLGEEENLLILLSDQDNKAASSTILGPTARAEIQIEGTFFKDLKTGSGNLFLVRKKKGEKTEGQSMIQYDLNYYTIPLKIEILP